MPAKNEEQHIASAISSILRQDYADLEVVVVDGGSTDRTASIVAEIGRADPRVTLLTNEDGRIPRSLNMGLAAAEGAWLVRMDAHSTVPPGYVRQAVEHLRTGRWGGVGGRKDGYGETPAGHAIAAVLGSRFGVGGSDYHHAVAPRVVDHVPFGAYPVELVREMGGWDERFPANEDFEFDYRLGLAGHRLLLDPTMRIRWRSRQSIGELYAQYQRYGASKVAVAMEHPRSLRPRHLLPPILVAGLALAALAATRRPRPAVAALSPYLVALSGASWRIAKDLESRQERLLVPVAFVTMHVGWGLGFWRALVRRAAAHVARRQDEPRSVR